MRIEAALLAVVSLAVSAPPTVAAQDTSVHFGSFDVGIGGVAVHGTSPGLSYGVGADLVNLPFRGLSGRFGFRFWSTADAAAGTDIDDSLFELVLRKYAGEGRVRGYAGAGFGAHFVSARLRDDPAVEDARDGFHPGLQLQLGAEVGLGDEFLAAFVEGIGSVTSDLRHAMVQAGIRVRFDRLGAR